MKKPRSILIVRLSSIGDVVMASPLIGAFHRTCPDAAVSWLVEETSRPVLEINEGLEEVIVWNRREWRQLLKQWRFLRLAKEISSFIRELRRKRFDLAVDAQGLLKSAVWAYLSGAGERIGIGSREGSRFLMTRVVDRSDASDAVSSQYRLLAQALNLNIGEFRMEVVLSADAIQYAEGIARSLPRPYVVFSPFTTRAQKHWVNERWMELADRFEKKTTFAVVLLGGPDEREDSEKIFPDNTNRRINLTGKTSLQQAGGIVKKAALVIGVDTGLTHMGIALDTPTIALFGATRPYLDTAGTSGMVLYHPRECSPCRRSPTCEGDYTCMKAIYVDEVFSTALAVLETR